MDNIKDKNNDTFATPENRLSADNNQQQVKQISKPLGLIRQPKMKLNLFKKNQNQEQFQEESKHQVKKRNQKAFEKLDQKFETTDNKYESSSNSDIVYQNETQFESNKNQFGHFKNPNTYIFKSADPQMQLGTFDTTKQLKIFNDDQQSQQPSQYFKIRRIESSNKSNLESSQKQCKSNSIQTKRSQNRESAKKYRIKKRGETQSLNSTFQELKDQNDDIKKNINNMTMLLYKEIENNQQMHEAIEQDKLQHSSFLAKINKINIKSRQLDICDHDRFSVLHHLVKDHLQQLIQDLDIPQDKINELIQNQGLIDNLKGINETTDVNIQDQVKDLQIDNLQEDDIVIQQNTEQNNNDQMIDQSVIQENIISKMQIEDLDNNINNDFNDIDQFINEDL